MDFQHGIQLVYGGSGFRYDSKKSKCYDLSPRMTPMPQLQIPLFPEGTTLINQNIGFLRQGTTVTYVHGSLPVFTHDIDDLASFRMFHQSAVYQRQCQPGRDLSGFRSEQGQCAAQREIVPGKRDGRFFRSTCLPRSSGIDTPRCWSKCNTSLTRNTLFRI